MSDNGTNHDRGVCDNCGAKGRLGYVVGQPDKTHKHSCSNTDCRDALENIEPAPWLPPEGTTP